MTIFLNFLRSEYEALLIESEEDQICLKISTRFAQITTQFVICVVIFAARVLTDWWIRYDDLPELPAVGVRSLAGRE